MEELKLSNAKLQKSQEENLEYIKKMEGLIKGLTATPIDATSFNQKNKNNELSVEDAEKL